MGRPGWFAESRVICHGVRSRMQVWRVLNHLHPLVGGDGDFGIRHAVALSLVAELIVAAAKAGRGRRSHRTGMSPGADVRFSLPPCPSTFAYSGHCPGPDDPGDQGAAPAASPKLAALASVSECLADDLARSPDGAQSSSRALTSALRGAVLRQQLSRM